MEIRKSLLSSLSDIIMNFYKHPKVYKTNEEALEGVKYTTEVLQEYYDELNRIADNADSINLLPANSIIITPATTDGDYQSVADVTPGYILTSDYPNKPIFKPINPDHFLGLYISLVALQTAHPTASPGDYAQVDPGPGTDVMNYLWDADEGWLEGGSGGVVPAATESIAGIAKIATSTDTAIGTDDSTIITPKKLKEVILAMSNNTGNKLFNFYNFR